MEAAVIEFRCHYSQMQQMVKAMEFSKTSM